MNITTTIKPSDINPTNGFMNSLWQNAETETSVYYLVKLAQKNGDWRDFTKAEIDAVAKEDFWFNKLKKFGNKHSTDKNDDIIYNKKTNLYSFTDRFIVECYRLSPSKKKTNHFL